jgi:hypothetical protein
LAVLAGGCGGGHQRSCPAGFIGDQSLPPEVQMLATDGKSMMLSPVNDGDSLLMEPPPQGGFVLYIGAAVRNVDGCNLELAGRLRDPNDNTQLGFDARDTDLVVGADGWGRSDPSDNSNEANVNACPDITAADRVNGSFVMELKATDRGGRTATVSHPVKLICDPSLPNAGYAECVCTCSANYFLGKCAGFTIDGGT